MTTSIEMDTIDGSPLVTLFESKHQNLISINTTKLYKSGNSVLLELVNCTNILGAKNVTGTTININNISHMSETELSTLTKIIYCIISFVGSLLFGLVSLAQYLYFDSDIIAVIYWIFMYLYIMGWIPITLMMFYYASIKYLVLHSNNGNEIKINTKKVANYSELVDKLRESL